MSTIPTDSGQVPSARDWERRLEDEAAERELEAIIAEEPDLVLAIDYASGELSPEQAAAFEERMVNNEALQRLVLPLLQLRQELREGRDRAVEQGGEAARRAWERLQSEAAQHEEQNDVGEDEEESGSRPPRRVAAAAGARNARNRRIFRVVVRILGLAAICYVGAYALSLVGFAPLMPSWNVVRDETAPRTWLELRNGVSLSAAGPVFVAERWPGLIGGGDRFSELAELYVDSPDFTITRNSSSPRPLRIMTPQLEIRMTLGVITVRRENGCEVLVNSIVHPITVTSRLTTPPTTREVGTQEGVRMSCDGTLGRPGTYTPSATGSPGAGATPPTSSGGAPS